MSTNNDELFSDAGGEQWEVISSIKKRIALKWMIEKFSHREIHWYPEIRSPTFNFLSSKWYFSLFPNGQEEGEKGKVSLYLEMINPKPKTEIKFKFYLKDRNGKDQYENDSTDIFSADYSSWGNVLIDRKILLEEERSELLNDDILTVCCELRGWENVDNKCQFVDKPAATKKKNGAPPIVISKGTELLLNDLEGLFREKWNCDISIQVGIDTFQAHKCILAARSSVFAAMFQHDMKENRSNEITITDIEPAVMSNVLEYIYSGKVNDNTVEKALGLYVAADKYALNELRTQCADLLRGNLSVDNVFDIAVLADAHNDGMIIDSIKLFVGENTSFLSGENSKRLVKLCPNLASEVIVTLSQKLSTKS